MPANLPSTIKVLHLGKYFPPHFGGIETFMSQLMLAQKKSGLDVAAIVHRQATQYQTPCETWHGCYIYPVKSHGQLIYAPMAPSFGLRLYQAMRKQRPDVVHIHMPNLSAFWLLLLKPLLPKAKWIIHWHSDVLGAAPDWKVKLLYPLYRVFERGLLKNAQNIICTSPNYLESSEPLQAYRHKCAVVPLGIDIEETVPGNHGYSTQTESYDRCSANDMNKPVPLRLLMIGRLTYYKGHMVLFEAVRQLRDKGIELHLDVVGQGELGDMLQQYIKRHGLQAKITLHGAVSEQAKQNLLQSADLLCLPSIERTEAFGVVLLEAAAHAKPALVTNVAGSGMSYVVEIGKSGLVVEAGSVDALVFALTQINQQPETLKVMGQAAYHRLVECFDTKQIVRQIDVLYHQPGN